jgi:hypothetical protein
MIDDNTPEIAAFSPEARRAMRRRHLAIALQMQAIAAHALRELQTKIEGGQPLNVSAEDARKLLDAGLRLERSAKREKQDDDPLIAPVSSKKPH